MEFLLRAHRERDLQGRKGTTVKTMVLGVGQVVVAVSNRRKDRLGQALMALGRIQDDNFKNASDLLKTDRRRVLGRG